MPASSVSPAMGGLVVVEDHILRLPEVLRATGLSRSTLYRQVAAGKFPPPAKLGLLAVGWSSAEVQNWMAARLAARNAA